MTNKKQALDALAKVTENLGGITKLVGNATQEIALVIENLANEEETVKEAPKKEAPKKVAPKEEIEEVEEIEEIDEDEIEEGEDDFYTETELKGMKVPEIKEVLDEMGVEYKAKESKPNLIDLVLEAQFEGDDEEEIEEDEVEEDEIDEIDEDELEEEEIEEEEEDDEEDLESMTLPELRKLAKEYGLKLPRKISKSKLIEAIEEAMYDDEDDTDEEAEEDNKAEIEEVIEEWGFGEEDYYSLDELKELAKESGLSTAGKREAIVFRIAEAVVSGDIKLEEE